MTGKEFHWIDRMNRMGKAGTPFLFILDYELFKPLVLTLDEARMQGIHVELPSLSLVPASTLVTGNLSIEKKPVPYPEYEKAFEGVMNHLKRGNSYLVNLTFPTQVLLNSSLDELFHAASAPYKLLYKDEFLVFSPEPFVRIVDNTICSYPMKGTIRASVPGARVEILSDSKEAAEHATIVDLIRNDLSLVATDVQVVRYRYIEEVHTHEGSLLQVSSEIRGRLPENYPELLGNIFSSILPAGSVTGAPKTKTLDIIKEVECMKRGYYTGIFGFFNGKDLESAVMIRYIERNGDQFRFRSGGGITVNSQVHKEYQELIDKVYVPIH